MSTDSGAPKKSRPTRSFFGLLGAYVSLTSFIALARSLQGGPVAPEIGSRAADCGLLFAALASGVLIVVTAIIAGRAPELAGKLGFAGGTLLLAQALVTAGFVLAWEPPDEPAMIGFRVGVLIGTGLWVAAGAAVLVLSARLRASSGGAVLVQGSEMPS